MFEAFGTESSAGAHAGSSLIPDPSPTWSRVAPARAENRLLTGGPPVVCTIKPSGPAAQRPSGPAAQRPSGPAAQRPSGPAAQRPSGMMCARREADAHRPAPSTPAGSSRPDPRPGRFRARLSRLLPALAMLLGALGLFAASPAQAQQNTVLVSNLDQRKGSPFTTKGWVFVQGFATGSAGSALSSIETRIGRAPNDAQRATIRAELWSAAAGGGPGSKVADLTVPATVSRGTVSFAAPANTVLSANTTYFFVLYTTGDFNLAAPTVRTGNEDRGGQPGWSIRNQFHKRKANRPGPGWTENAGAYITMPIRVKGEVLIWEANPQAYTVFEGVAPLLEVRLSRAAPAGGLTFTLKPLLGAAVPGDKCRGNRKATAADLGANPPTTLTVPAGSVKGVVAFPTAHDFLVERDECFAIQFAGTQATVDAGWTASTEDGPYGDSSAAQVTVFNVPPLAAPAALVVTPGDGRLDLTWTAPEADSSTQGTVDGYDVHYTSATVGAVANGAAVDGNTDPSAGWVAVSRSGATATQAITGLANGKDYRVRVRGRASNGGSPGFWAFGTGTVVERAAPGAPTGLGVTAGSGGLSLSWTAPATGVVRSYDVHYTSSTSVDNDANADGSDPSAAWVDAAHTGTNAWHRIDSLTDGTAYKVRVRAVNAAGASAWARGTGTPSSGAPSAPPGLSVGGDHRKLNLRWRKPAGAVTSYDVHYTSSTSVDNDADVGSNTNPATGWVNASHTGTGVTQAISSLTNGTAYKVRVRGVNANGDGAWARGTGTPLPIMGFTRHSDVVVEGRTDGVPVKLSEALASATTVRVEVVPDKPATGRATETDDFTLSSRTLTFPAGTTEKRITVSAVADRTTEGNEDFYLRLAAPDGAPYRVGEDSQQSIYAEISWAVLDNSLTPGLRIDADDTVGEGNSFKVLVRIGSPAPSGGTAVTLSLGAAGTATEGVDFRLSGKAATIAEGETSVEVTFTALDDAADDNGETVVLNASTSEHTAPARTVTIVDNDLPSAPAPENVQVTPGPGTLTVTWEVPAGAETVDPDYGVWWGYRGTGQSGWAQIYSATPEQFAARSVTADDLGLFSHEVGIWFSYEGEPDPVAAPGVTRYIESRTVIAKATPQGVPPSVPRNVQAIPGDGKIFLLWKPPATWGSFPARGFSAATDCGAAPGWRGLHQLVGFDWEDPARTSATLRGPIDNNLWPENGRACNIRIKTWTSRPGAQPDEETGWAAGDYLDSDWVTVNVTPQAGLADPPTSIALTGDAAGNRVDEDAGTVTLTATLNRAARSATTLSLSAGAASDATLTDDYTLSAATLTIAAGERSATATLTVVDDTAAETDEVVELVAATTGDVVLTSSALTITIADNDAAVAAPTGLTVTPGDGTLDLAWTAPSGSVTGYDVEYKEGAASDAPATTPGDPATGWVAVSRTEADPPAASQAVSGLTNDVAYDVRVRASAAGDASVWTPGSGTPSALPALATPANFALTPGDGQITARWDAVANANRYVVLHGARGSGTFQRVETGGALAWTVTGLTNGIAYRLSVQARDTTGNYGTSAQHPWLEATPALGVSADANLSALTASAAESAGGAYAALTLTRGATGYTATVADGASHVKLTPVTAHAAATVTVDGTAVASGSQSAAIALAGSGETAIMVQVTAADGVTVKDHTVTVMRQAPRSSDATLSALAAGGSTSAGGTYSTLDIGTFSGSTTGYTATVGHSLTHVKLTPTANHAAATVGVRKGTSGAFTAVTSGRASAAIALDVGANALTVRVTAEDASTRDYTVTVTRQAAGLPLTASFEGVPAEHDGKTAFAVLLRLSEPAATLGRPPRAASFSVRQGRVQRVERAGADLWRVWLKPTTMHDVQVTLAGGRGCAEAGAVCTRDGRALQNTVKATVGGQVRIFTWSAIAKEGRDPHIQMLVQLSRTGGVEQPVTVDWETADGTTTGYELVEPGRRVRVPASPATAGADYTATSGTLAFAPGEWSKFVEVPLLDDAIDERVEYFLVRFSNPQGAVLAQGQEDQVALIYNDDHLQSMWLARFGTMAGSHLADAVSDRLGGDLSPGAHATVAGQSLDLTKADDAEALANAMAGLAQRFGEPGGPASNDDDPFAPHGTGSAWNDPTTAGAHSMTGRELLLGSAFQLATDGDGSGPALAAWGRVAHGSFDAEHADDSGSTRVDGEVLTGVLGADADFGRVLAGVAVSLSEGDGKYDSPDVDVGATGRIESTLTTVSPYLRFKLTERVSAWGLAGFGSGDMTIRFDDGSMAPVRTDLSMRLGAIGARGALLEQADTGGMDLALKADAFFVRMESEKAANSAETTTDTNRVRLVLEGGRAFALSQSATLRPSLELGLRHDGGDAETGAGVELGGGVAWTDAASGLSLEAKARMLVAHADSDYEEWGMSATARLDPGETGRGLSLSLAPTIGTTSSASERLWGARDARSLAPGGEFEAARGLQAEAGYGLPLFGGRFTGTPNAGLGLADGGARDWRIGWRLTSAVPGDSSFEVNLDATRREAANDEDAEHGVMLRGAVRW